MAANLMRIKVVLLTKEEEQVTEEEKEKKSVEGNEKVKQKEDEEKALDEVKFFMRNLIKENALMNNLEVDIIELHHVTDLEQLADVSEIQFVAAEQIFVNDLILYLERVSEDGWIPVILFSSNSNGPKLKCLSKGNKNLDMSDIEMGYIGELMENYSSLCHSYNVKKKKADDQVVEGGLGQEVKVHVGQEEVQIQTGHDQIVEGEAGQKGHVEAQLPWPIKLKKRWERDWLKLKKRWEKDWVQSLKRQ